MSVVAMIPARMGSERLPIKNLALLNGEPLISYAIRAAKNSGVFDRIVVNSDGSIFQEIADRYDVEFYLRPEYLGSSDTKSDDVIYDFMLKHPADIMAWVNPISPLQPSSEVANVINHFIVEGLDSLITVKNEQVHCVYDGAPLNFVVDELFAKTQDLVPVQSFVYSIMMWRTSSFLDTYRRQGYALLCGNLGYYPVSKRSSVIIKNDEDLMMAETLLNVGAEGKVYQILYDDLINASR